MQKNAKKCKKCKKWLKVKSAKKNAKKCICTFFPPLQKGERPYTPPWPNTQMSPGTPHTNRAGGGGGGARRAPTAQPLQGGRQQEGGRRGVGQRCSRGRPREAAGWHPPCDIPSGCWFVTGPWTVTRSSLRMLRRGAAFCRPLLPVLLLVLFPRSRSPVVGVLGLC